MRFSKRSNNALGEIYHGELLGKRTMKYSYLQENGINNKHIKRIDCVEPDYFFVPKDFSLINEYNNFFKVDDAFIINSNGIETQKDAVNIFFEGKDAIAIKNDFLSLDKAEIIAKYKIKEGRDWTINSAKSDLQNCEASTIIQYRPFDFRATNYTGKTKGIMAYPRDNVMKHMVNNDNLGLCFMRQHSSGFFSFSLVTKHIIDNRTFYSNRGKVNLFPLYSYSEKQVVFDDSNERVPNLNLDIIENVAASLSLNFTKEKKDTKDTFAPIDLLDYIYAILHSPSYREKYKEFLKIDFPRVPYPEDKETFWKLVKKGGELRQIHLMESPTLENHDFYFPVDGSNEVEKPVFKGNKVFINKDQYFDNAPELAWNFYIGGYQPAQKWLKDRKGRVLEYDDISHYQKIIKALVETDRIMKEIDDVR